MKEHINMEGKLTLTLTDREGRVISERVHKNRIVKTGRRLVAELFAGVTAGPPPTRVTHMAVGTGAAAAADDQTGLGAERAPRKPITEIGFAEFDEGSGGTATRRVKATLKAIFDFDEANDLAVPLREAGIFTAASGGVMYNRVVFEPVTKTNAFKLTMLWDITF
jgi:hypothetical protein